jgi:hypothetical protein
VLTPASIEPRKAAQGQAELIMISGRAEMRLPMGKVFALQCPELVNEGQLSAYG